MKAILHHFLLLAFSVYHAQAQGPDPMMNFPQDTSSQDSEHLARLDRMPRFPGCEETEGDEEAKLYCANYKLLEYINKKIEYPRAALEAGVSGIVVISFLVKEDGSIDDIKIIKDPGEGLGKEAERIVKSMNNMPNNWIPATRLGQPVSFRYSLPFKFRLPK